MPEKLLKWFTSVQTYAVVLMKNKRLVNRVAELEAEITNLKNEIAEKDRKLTEFAAKEKFVKHRGVFWEPDTSGGHMPDPICPRCRIVLWQTEDFLPFRCSSCEFKSPFLKSDLISVFGELNHKTKSE